ncbi:MAG: ABC transporter ATP-binding protein [Polyangiales bacterium]
MQVRVHALTRRYEGVTALDDVTLSVPPGRTALLGPNGAGKSTLLKILLGLTRASSGHVEVLGVDPARDPLAVRSRVGYMPEDDAHLPGMSAVELCTYGAELAGLPPREAMERAHAALFYVGLDDKRYLPVEGYSTGLKQRAKLAAAIVHDPDLLFLDEPTNGLDPASREEMLQLVADLKTRRGCDVVLSTHILRDVERVCDHVLVLGQGRLVADAPLKEMMGQDDGRYVVRIKGDPDAFVERLKANGCTAEKPLDAGRSTWVVVPPIGAAGVDAVWRAAVESGAQVRHLAPRTASLDETFVRLLS